MVLSLEYITDTALISTILMKVRVKENSTLEVSTFWTMEDSLFDKTGDATGKFCFWLLDIRFLAKIETKCSGLRRI